MSKAKRLCDRHCPNQASFLVRLRSSTSVETVKAVCGLHLTRTVTHLEEVARELGPSFEGEIVVASWRGGTDGSR